MLEALEHNDLHEDLLADFLGDILADLGLHPDSDSASAMQALGTVQTWWKKPEYALWHFVRQLCCYFCVFVDVALPQ
jgi:hypothetical protein